MPIESLGINKTCGSYIYRNITLFLIKPNVKIIAFMKIHIFLCIPKNLNIKGYIRI